MKNTLIIVVLIGGIIMPMEQLANQQFTCKVPDHQFNEFDYSLMYAYTAHLWQVDNQSPAHVSFAYLPVVNQFVSMLASDAIKVIESLGYKASELQIAKKLSNDVHLTPYLFDMRRRNVDLPTSRTSNEKILQYWDTLYNHPEAGAYTKIVCMRKIHYHSTIGQIFSSQQRNVDVDLIMKKWREDIIKNRKEFDDALKSGNAADIIKASEQPLI